MFPITNVHDIFFSLGIQELYQTGRQLILGFWGRLSSYRFDCFHLWLILCIIWSAFPPCRILITHALPLQHLSSRSLSAIFSQFPLPCSYLRDFFHLFLKTRNKVSKLGFLESYHFFTYSNMVQLIAGS